MTPRLTKEIFVLFCVHIYLCRGGTVRDVTHEPPTFFQFKELKITLPVNDHVGTVEADFEVSEYLTAGIKWWQRITPTNGGNGYSVPLTGGMYQDIYSFEWMGFNEQHVTSVVNFHPVPYDTLSTEIDLTTNDASMTYRMAIALSPVHSRRPVVTSYEGMQTLEHPDVITRIGENEAVELEFKIRGHNVDVIDLFKRTPSTSANLIFEEEAIVYNGNGPEDVVVSRTGTRYGEEVTVTWTVRQTTGDHVARYTVEFGDSSNGERIMLHTSVLPVGRESLFTDAPKLEVTACSGGQFANTATPAFSMVAGEPNCVRCVAVGSPAPRVSLYHNGMPLGSGLDHSVYWHPEGHDMNVLWFVLINPIPDYSSVYTCAAVSDDEEIQRDFEIRVA